MWAGFNSKWLFCSLKIGIKWMILRISEIKIMLKSKYTNQLKLINLFSYKCGSMLKTLILHNLFFYLLCRAAFSLCLYCSWDLQFVSLDVLLLVIKRYFRLRFGLVTVINTYLRYKLVLCREFFLSLNAYQLNSSYHNLSLIYISL